MLVTRPDYTTELGVSDFCSLGSGGNFEFPVLIGSVDSAMEYGLTSGRNLWYLRALPSCIPYMNAYLFNSLQALLIVFFVAEMEKRARVTTMEPLWTRPCTNGELQWGRVLGLAGMVVVLNIISMLVTLMVHLFTPKGSVEVSMYVFYFFTLTLPGLVFFLGISMFVVHWIKSQGLAILLLLMLIAGMVGVREDYMGCWIHWRGRFPLYFLLKSGVQI